MNSKASTYNIIGLILNGLALIFFVVCFFLDQELKPIINGIGWLILIFSFLIRILCIKHIRVQNLIKKSYKFEDKYVLYKKFYFKKTIKINDVIYEKNDEFTPDICNYHKFLKLCEDRVLKT